MITDVHPKEMHIKHDVNVINFHQWLLNKIDSKEIPLTRQLNMRVTVHDNCYSKAGGGQYWDPPREILKRTGCDIVEMEHIREQALCCGFGAGASWDRPIHILFDIMDVAGKKIKEAEATGADALISYCGGCLYLLWTARELFGSKLDIYHIVEIQRMAMGEQLNYPKDHVRRAWDLIAIITYLMILSLFGRNFMIKEISLDRSPVENRNFPFVRLIRRLLDVPLIQSVYKKIFKIMVKLLKSKKRIVRCAG
jgi:hypothetical protein